jgi:REP element-mobilizing transposase RayT
MARGLRIQFPGAYYHVMARGNRREAIFLDDEDRRFFLHALGQACQMTGWRIHAWILMNNHYHLFVETPEPNLVSGMQWLQNACTRRHNVRHGRWGRLFGDRYKAVLVEGTAAGYYQTLMDYIHLNAVRARVIQPNRGHSVLDYPWSSVAGGYALPPRRRAPWLAAQSGLKEYGFEDTTQGRRRMVERLDRRAVVEAAARCGIPETSGTVDERCSHLRRGWYWGTQAFAERMLKLAEAKLSQFRSRNYRGSGLNRAHGQAQAERWLREGLVAAGLQGADLRRLRGSDPRKVALARMLWEGTTVSQGWIAGSLHMRSAANVSQLLRRVRNPQEPEKLAESFSKWMLSVKIC